MKKMEEDKNFLSDLNAFIDSKKKTPEKQNNKKEKDPLGLNFGNILKFRISQKFRSAGKINLV